MSGRHMSALVGVLAVLLLSATANAQTQVFKPGELGAEPGEAEPIDPDDTRPIDPDTGEAIDPDEEFVVSANDRDRRVESSRLAEQVEVDLGAATRRGRRFETAFEKVQRQFADIEPGKQVTVPQEVLDRFKRELDGVRSDFVDVRRGLERLGRTRDAKRADELIGALDTLQERLALVGLVLVKSDDGVRYPNELRLSLEVLEESLDALPEFSAPRVVGREGEIIRPPEGFEPSREIIRPPRGVEPSREIIRPPRGVEPSREIIRPADGVEPSREIIRPPKSGNPATGDGAGE